MMRLRRRHRQASIVSTTVMTLALVGLGVRAHQAPAPGAETTLKDAQGETVGRALLTEAPHGVLIHLTLSKPMSGTHALHIHTTGSCVAPGFQSAGGHFSPGGTQHGIMNPQGPHAGDLPNIFPTGSAGFTAEVLASGVTLKAGPTSLFDADGSALVIHAGADDYQTNPSGNAGDRVACGVIQR